MPIRSIERWMWADAWERLERAEKLHRRFFQAQRGSGGRHAWIPPVDIFETDREYWICVALPGVEPDALDVALEQNMLVVTGRRCLPAAAQTAEFRRLEIPYGRFERRIELPEEPIELRRHELSNGCLTLLLVKRR